MRTHRIAAMGGDGIGPEVVAAGVELVGVVLQAIRGTKRTATAAGIIERFTNIGTSVPILRSGRRLPAAPARAQ